MVDRRQRSPDSVEQFRSGFEGMQSDVWTSFPATIDSVDFDAMTVTAQPAIQAQVTGQDGTAQWVDLPLLLDCPISFPSGGGYTLTFPLKQGDECLIVIASRCIDNWWAQNGNAGPSGTTWTQAEIRMHDLSDGMCIPGIKNKSRVISEISTADVQLRSDEGSSFLSIRENGDILAEGDAKITLFAENDVDVSSTTGNINVTATAGNVDVMATAGSIIATAPLITATASTSMTVDTPVLNVVSALTTFTGILNIVGTLQLNGIPFGLTHEHSGVSTGTHNTGPVV
jgi:hypothetical protein